MRLQVNAIRPHTSTATMKRLWPSCLRCGLKWQWPATRLSLQPRVPHSVAIAPTSGYGQKVRVLDARSTGAKSAYERPRRQLPSTNAAAVPLIALGATRSASGRQTEATMSLGLRYVFRRGRPVQPVAPVGTADPGRAPPDWFGSVNLYLGEDRLCGLLLEID
jgi:hypothetical protein